MMVGLLGVVTPGAYEKDRVAEESRAARSSG